MTCARKTSQRSTPRNSETGCPFGPIAEKLMGQWLKRCAGSKMRERLMTGQGEGPNCASIMAQMMEKAREDEFCADLMASCCGEQEASSGEPSDA